MRSLLVGLGVPAAAAGELTDDLVARYAEPHRRYHTGEHLTEVMGEVYRLLFLVRCSANEASAVRLAVWFHDAVYDPTVASGGNEDASANLATAGLSSAGVPRSLVSEVARLVRLTADHAVDPTDVAGSVLVDADLSVLASIPDRYDRYVRDVRAEYGHVDDDAWCAGRAVVLRRFIDASPLYRIGPDRAVRERGARTNMERELAAFMVRAAGQRCGESVGDADRPPGAGGRAPEG